MTASPSESKHRVQLALDFAEVIAVQPVTTLPHSFVARVELADGHSLFFKQAAGPQAAQSLIREIAVNQQVLARMPGIPAPAVIASDGTAAQPWLALADLSKMQPLGGAPPDLAIEAFVDAMAIKHALSQRMDLRATFATVGPPRHVTDGEAQVQQLLKHFLDGRPSLADREVAFLARLCERVPDLGARIRSMPQALVHGDAHFGNGFSEPALTKKQTGSNPAVLIDWAMATRGPSETDLSHALAMNLSRDLSRNYERKAIERFAERCNAVRDTHDIEPVDAAEVFERYRTCTLQSVVIAIALSHMPGLAQDTSAFLLSNALKTATELDALSVLD